MKKISLLFIFCLIMSYLMSQVNESMMRITEKLIRGDELAPYEIDNDYRISCHRLQISYKEVANKEIIGLESFSEMRPYLNSRQTKINETRLDSVFSMLTLKNTNVSDKSIYFRNHRLVSSAFYHKTHCQSFNGEYVRFYYTDKSRFNQFAARNLDDEIQSFLRLSGKISNSAKVNLLKKEKIHYIIVRDMDEMEKITGYRTNGIALLNEDTVVSIDPAHFHEVVHILINFIRDNPPLFTHPLFQEGLAVALGGRSGRSAETMLEAGDFLIKSGFVSVNDLLTTENFNQTDPSLSYPVSAYLVKSEINKGFESFLNLYNKYSCNAIKFNTLTINKKDLSNDSEREKFYQTQFKILTINDKKDKLIFKNNRCKIYEYSSTKKQKSIFKIVLKKGSFSFSDPINVNGYQSRIFKENCPERVYKQEHFLIKADENEVILYDLYLDKILFMISNGFSTEILIHTIGQDQIEFLTDQQILIDLLKK